MSVPEPVYGLLLAGGESRRMGHDKASLKVAGETQLERAARRLGEHVERVFVSARAEQADDPLRGRFDCIVDRYDDLGPVAGILSAYDEHPGVSWLVLACDLPNIDAATLEFLLQHASATRPFTAFISVEDGLPEPLCALYRPPGGALLRGFVDEGLKCPRKMLIRSDTCLLEQPRPGALVNVNRPEDLEGTGIELAP